MKFTPGIYTDISFEDYLKIDAVNASYLKAFSKTPANADVPIEPSRNMIIGTAIHALTLEGISTFEDQFATAPICDKRTKEGKQIWADFEEMHSRKTIISADEALTVRSCCNSIYNHPLASMFLKESEGQPEVTLIWVDDVTGLKCKARLDRLPNAERKAAIDLKSTSDATIKGFGRQIVNFNYDLQAAFYLMGCRHCLIDVETFLFVAVQTSEPYTVGTYFLNSDYLAWADSEINRLMGLVKECKQSNFFPAYEIPKHIMSIYDVKPYDLLEELEMPKWR